MLRPCSMRVKDGYEAMDFRVLRYFLTVARTGSMTRAAELLHVTQPTLSRQLQDLEEELGQPLLLRKYHRIELTEKGFLLFRRAEEILELVRKTERDLQSGAGEVEGDVFLGGGETQGFRPLARIFRKLREECPGVRLHLFSGTANDVMERLDKGTLDFGLLIQPGLAARAKYECLDLPGGEPWGLLLRRDDALAGKRRIAVEDLAGAPLLLPVRHAQFGAGAERGFPEWCGEAFSGLNVVGSYNLIYNAAILVEEGVGCAVGMRLIARPGLVFRPFSPTWRASLCVAWKKRQALSPAAGLFLARMKEAFGTGAREK